MTKYAFFYKYIYLFILSKGAKAFKKQNKKSSIYSKS